MACGSTASRSPRSGESRSSHEVKKKKLLTMASLMGCIADAIKAQLVFFSAATKAQVCVFFQCCFWSSQDKILKVW